MSIVPQGEPSARRPRLVVAVTDPISCTLLRGQLAFADRQGFDVALLCAPGAQAEQLAQREHAALLPVAMARKPAPVPDLVALVRIWGALGRFRPDVVNAGTPKAGLLVTLAAWLRRVPVRIYTLRGLYVETSSGPRRLLLHGIEWLTCRLAHRVICVSPSVRERALDLGIVSAAKAVVLGAGSSNGIDVTRFKRTPALQAQARTFRAEAGIADDAVLVGFVGRFVRDKGFLEIAECWAGVRAGFPAAHLLLVGAFEDAGIPASIRHRLESDPRVHFVGGWVDPTIHYAAMDLLILPTYREGLPNVLLEGGAMELPVVATRVTGCTDAVEDGVTGTLVEPRDAGALGAAIGQYLGDPALRARHGRAGRERIERNFAQERVWGALGAEYTRLLSSRSLPVPPSRGEEPACQV